MSFNVKDVEGIHALYQNREELRTDGWAVTDRDAGSCLVELNTGTLGSGENTLVLRSGTALVDGTETDISEQYVDVPLSSSEPRKDVVVLDSAGAPNVITGTAEPLHPSNSTLEAAERPAPPDLSGMDVVPLAIVLVPGDSTSITSSEIIDIRANGDVAAGTVSATVGDLLDRLGIPVYSDDANAPVETLYFYSPESLLKYKDSSGVVHESGSGATSLSDLSIDTDKDWGGYSISNLGTVSATGDITTGGDSVATDVDLSNHTGDTTNPHSVTNDQVSAPSQTEFDNYTSNTFNPHSVTNDQVNAPSDTVFTNHTEDTSNPHSVTASQANALPDSGGTVTGNVTIDGDLDVTGVHHLETVRDASNFSGTDGGAQIQAALDDLPAESGTVFVPAEGPDTNGRWDVSSTIVLPSNASLVGVPDATQLFLVASTNADVVATATDSTATNATKENITIEGLHIDGNGANQSGTGGTYLYGSCAIRPLNVNGCTVRDCSTTNTYKHGIEVKKSKNVTVENCVAANAGDDGISVTDTLFDSSFSENVTVRDCEAYGASDNGFEVDDGPWNVRFVGCHSHDNSTNGFVIHTHTATEDDGTTYAPAAPHEIHITDCSSVNNSKLGYAVGHHKSGTPKDYFLDGVSAIGNGESPFRSEISSASDETVDVTNVNVNDFYFEGAAEQNAAGGYTAGLRLDKATPWNDISFTNGVITGTLGYGIYLRRTSIYGLTVDNVTIEGANIASYMVFGDTQDNGNTIQDFKFTNCTVKNGSAGGLAINAGASDAFIDGQVANCTFKNNGTSGSGSQWDSGIVLAGGGTVENIAVTGNTCYDDQETTTQQYGIYRADSDYCTWTGNICHGNEQAQFGGSLGTNSKEAVNISR